MRFGQSKADGISAAGYIDELDQEIFPFISYESYADRYPACSILQNPPSFYAELREAARELFFIFNKALRVFQKCPDEFMTLMDMPPKLRPFLDIPNKMDCPTYLSRFDFILDKAGQFKCVELNADTPCALVEAYYGNGIAADFVGRRDPNEGTLVQLRSLLRGIAEAAHQFTYHTGSRDLLDDPFVFSCFHDYIEDLATTKFLMAQLPEKWTKTFVSFYDLAVDDHGVLLPDGRHAGILYRLHPLELLVEETGPDGFLLGTKLLELYKCGKFMLFNPPESIILQCKGFQALVWGLYEEHEFFDRHEREIIEKYLTPSYFVENRQKLAGAPYIKKPIWGREGNGISLYDAWGKEIMQKSLTEPNEVVERQSCTELYQKFIESRRVRIDTDSGVQNGYMTYSCFMTADKPSAVYSRFSPDEICGVESYWVPLVE